MKMDVYDREMRYKANALQDLGYQLPMKGKDGTIVMSSSAPGRSPDNFSAHSQIAKGRKGYRTLSSLFQEHEMDPAFKASLAYFPVLYSSFKQLVGFHAETARTHPRSTIWGPRSR